MYIDGMSVGIAVAFIVLNFHTPRESLKEYFTNKWSLIQGSIIGVVVFAWMFHPSPKAHALKYATLSTTVALLLYTAYVNKMKLKEREKRADGYEDAVAKLHQFEGGREYAEQLNEFEYTDGYGEVVLKNNDSNEETK